MEILPNLSLFLYTKSREYKEKTYKFPQISIINSYIKEHQKIYQDV